MKFQNRNKTIFSKKIPNLSEFIIKPLELNIHAKFIHEWVNRDYARFWQMQGTSLEQVIAAYQKLQHLNDYQIYFGYFNEEPIFLLECYHPRNTVLAEKYQVEESDYGMHILIAPPERKIKSFTSYVFITVMEFIFCDKNIQRVVVEPDIRNEKIHTLNKKMGFVYEKKIILPEKEAYLAFCTREQFQKSLKMHK